MFLSSYTLFDIIPNSEYILTQSLILFYSFVSFLPIFYKYNMRSLISLIKIKNATRSNRFINS